MIVIDARRRSFLDVAADSHFPIQNLPYGAFKRPGVGVTHLGVAIGDHIFDLTLAETEGLLESPELQQRRLFQSPTLNTFMGAGRPVWDAVRKRVAELLDADHAELRDNTELRNELLVPMNDAVMCMPAEIGDYTDFYSSKYHATNVGIMFRGKENALMPNYTWVPVAYHGRASSVVLSGTEIRRPVGQSKADDADAPTVGPCRLLDFELEMGFFIGPGSSRGEPIPVGNAMHHIFGMVLVNDWSARDIQKWEYQPLGPFLSKNFATSISPWVVPMDALEPFRCDGPEQDPAPLPYLSGEKRRAYDIHLDVLLKSPDMSAAARISRSNFRHMYWTICQQLAHHTISGCNLRPGDLLASGTLSGPTPDSYGSLLELAWRGTKPVKLSDTAERKFLQDHDTLTLTGWCEGEGFRVGFGEVSGKILPALSVE